MAFPELDASGKFPRKKLGKRHLAPKLRKHPKFPATGMEYVDTAKEARGRGQNIKGHLPFGAWSAPSIGKPFPGEPAGYNQGIQDYMDQKGAKELGISVEAYRAGLHKDLGGEDWVNQIPRGDDESWARALVDEADVMAAEKEHKNRPQTEQEMQAMAEKEFRDSIVEDEKRRAHQEYTKQQRALGGNAMMSNAGLSGGISLTAEDALLAAQLSPYWKAASLGKAGYDVATGEAPAWWDVGLATVGYGAKTKQGKKAVSKLKDLWRKAPKREMAAVTIPFFASEAKKGAYPKEEFRPKPVEPKKIDYGRPTRNHLDRIRRQTMLR